MNPSAFSTWLSIAANIGLIAGLVLVGVQINQNSELLRLQMIDQESRRATDHEKVYVGEIGAETWAKVISDPRNLTLTEQRVAESLIWSMFEAWRNSYKLHQAGLLGPEWKDRVIEEVPYVLDHPYGRAWWRNLKVDAQPDEIATELGTLVDQILSQPRDFHANYHKGIMDLLEEELDKYESTPNE